LKLGVGERIGVWEVKQALGRGGMGTVYRCTHVEAPRLEAAVKVLGDGLHRPSEAQVRFIREAEILGGLDHPHIVRVRGLRMDVHPPFIEMDYVAGKPLDRVVKEGPTPVDQALRWMIQLTSALAYLHGKGVRHRDVKPGNVLVTDDDRVVLVDFGLATDSDLERITQEGLSFGTVSYAPPEWMDPDRLEATHWDLYAVAVIFHELLTGAIAFPLSGKGPVRKQLLQVAMAKQKSPPLDPGEDIPEPVRAVIRKATQKEVGARYGSAEELLAALEGAQRGEGGVTLPRPSLPVAGVVAGGLLLSLGIVGATLWVTAPAETQVVSEGPQPVLDPEVAPPQDGGIRVSGPPGAKVRSGQRSAMLDDEGTAVLTGVPQGQQAVEWIHGEGCDACLDGGECPSFCGHGTIPVDVAAADEVSVELPELPWTPVSVELPQVAKGKGGVFKKKDWPLTVTVGDRQLKVSGPGVATGTAHPGTYPLVIAVGECSADELGCMAAECPPKCSSLRRSLTVPWDGKVELTLSKVPPPQR